MKRLTATLSTVFLAGAACAAPALTDEPLDPDKAFRPDARLVAGLPSSSSGSERHGIDIDYNIAPGYYLYRNRLHFEVSPPTLLTGPPELPAGIEVDDPFIGRSAIFREHVTIHLPFVTSIAAPGRYKIKITAQGCAEERICYAPFPQEVVVDIAPGYRDIDASKSTGRQGLPR